jgi:hypothetical protein
VLFFHQLIGFLNVSGFCFFIQTAAEFHHVDEFFRISRHLNQFGIGCTGHFSGFVLPVVYSGDIDPLFREVDPTRQICLAGRTME